MGALLLLCGIGVAAVWLSVAMLSRGRFYKSLDPKSRPRRWVLIVLLVLLGVFVLWFPIWMMWPHSVIGRMLTGLFGLIFFLAYMTLTWFSGTVDSYVKRRGWRLR